MDPTQLVLLFLITKPLFLLAAIAMLGWRARQTRRLHEASALRSLADERAERVRRIQ